MKRRLCFLPLLLCPAPSLAFGSRQIFLKIGVNVVVTTEVESVANAKISAKPALHAADFEPELRNLFGLPFDYYYMEPYQFPFFHPTITS